MPVVGLCFGRVVYANALRSDGGGEAAETMNPIICVMISTNHRINSTYSFPVPARIPDLYGNIICSWVAEVAKADIKKVTKIKLNHEEMEDVIQMIRKYKALSAKPKH